MSRVRPIIFTFILMLFVVCDAYSMDFKNIVVFGDSLSDNGNFYSVDGYNPPAPYYQGRFSDGPVWFEYLTEELGVKGVSLDYAHGGAMTGTTNVQGDMPGFMNELEAYLAMAENAKKYPGSFATPKDTLFFIWIGANDFWSVSNAADAIVKISEATANVRTALNQLIAAGGNKFKVMNLPDLGTTPRFNSNNVTSIQATQISVLYNQSLDQLAEDIKAQYPEVNIAMIDAFSILSMFIANSEALGFTNTTDSKLDTSTGMVEEGNYLFWDQVHPTTMGHRLLAKEILASIECDSCRGNLLPEFDNNLILKVPSAELNGNSYSFTLIPYESPDKAGVFWSLDLDSVQQK